LPGLAQAAAASRAAHAAGALAAYEKHRPNELEALDRGRITSPLAGRLPPTPDTAPGAGLWLASQLCDLVQIYSSPGRTEIRLHQNL
jgi:hypothetical protein